MFCRQETGNEKKGLDWSLKQGQSPGNLLREKKATCLSQLMEGGLGGGRRGETVGESRQQSLWE